jgi:hypothetical protein
VLKVYEAFSGDKIERGGRPWQDFTKHVNRRNEIVHGGRQATKQEADDSIEAVEAVIKYLLERRPPD